MHALDYFVRREIAKKIAEEQEMDDQEAQVYSLPFKMKVQNIMEENKALDELTAKDKEAKLKEAEEEIEINFPSYFDEMQKQLLDMTNDRAQERELSPEEAIEVKHKEVAMEQAFSELIGVTEVSDASYRTEMLRLRLEIVQMCKEQTETVRLEPDGPEIQIREALEAFCERDTEWMEDALCCLQNQVQQAQLKSVMNISELHLPSTYNFYHDCIPQEARLIFQPLARIQQRVRDILAEYESPILNDLLFLSNYMMTSFNTKTTPLMKMLTGMELLLEKLDEWEDYASKRLNSCQDEATTIKQLIIRYRKI